MSFSEWNTLFGKVLRNIRGIEEAFSKLLLNLIHSELSFIQHVGKNLNAGFPRIHRIEEAFFILLEVLVVGKRRPLHYGQKLHQVAVDSAHLSAEQFRHIRVLLLRHDAAAGTVAVVDGDIREFLGVPPDEFFRPPGQVHHGDRSVREEFQAVVPVADAVHGVFRRRVKTQQLCRSRSVGRQSGSRQSASA